MYLNWLPVKNPVPPTSGRWHRFTELREDVNEFTQELLIEREDESDPRPINQAKQFYKGCVDVKATEAEELKPLLKIISAFGGWQLLDPDKWDVYKFDFVVAAAEVRRLTGESAVLSAYVSLDAKDTSKSVIYISQPGYGLPRSILNDREKYPEVMGAYKRCIMDVAKKLGTVLDEVDLLAKVEAMINFEITLTDGKTKGDQEDYYNRYTLSEYQSETNDIDQGIIIPWTLYLRVLFSTSGVTIAVDEDVVVRDLDYYRRVIPILKETLPSTLANYIMWRLIAPLLPETTEEMRDIVFNLEKVQTGATERNDREVTCAESALSAFGMAISVEYVKDEDEFDEDAKVEVNKLAKDLIISFEEMVIDEDWKDDRTKQAAIEKADAIRTYSAYPDWLKDKIDVEAYYKGLELADSHFQNQININIYKNDKELRTLRLPTDRDKWIDDPTTVNVFYSETLNSIYFPAAILQPSFFRKTWPKFLIYGLFGSLVAHEISHAFDSKGSQFNKIGNLMDLWDEDTRDEFDLRSQCMVEQYSHYFVERVKMYINGWLTLAENIADNAGLQTSYRAYQKHIQKNGPEKKLPGLESLSPIQLFFISFANLWGESITPEGLKYMILTDPHSPLKYRVIGTIGNTNEFGQAFTCPEDEDGMNLPESKECKVW